MNKTNLSVQSIGRAIANALSTKREQITRIPTRSGRSRVTRRNRRIQNGRNSGTQQWSRSLPATYANHVRPSFRVLNRSANSLRVAGCDLVYPLPARVTSTSAEEFLFSVIPANPAYWTGTRVAQMAPAYMNYRPLKMTFHYIPQVSVTQAGSVMFGTLWNGAAPSDDIQQSLNTSNGGGIINCYVPASTQISLGSNLQQNLFTLNGDINPSTSPFIFVAMARGCLDANNNNVIPGYFMVDYVYDFKNAIGQTWMYDRSLAISAPVTDWSLPNRSLILLESIEGYGPGTIFDAEEEPDGTVTYYYRGTEVDIPSGTLVQRFENGQTASIQALSAQLRQARTSTVVASASTQLVYVKAGSAAEYTGRMFYKRSDGAYALVSANGLHQANNRWYFGTDSNVLDLYSADGTLLLKIDPTLNMVISGSVLELPYADVPVK